MDSSDVPLGALIFGFSLCIMEPDRAAVGWVLPVANHRFGCRRAGPPAAALALEQERIAWPVALEGISQRTWKSPIRSTNLGGPRSRNMQVFCCAPGLAKPFTGKCKPAGEWLRRAT